MIDNTHELQRIFSKIINESEGYDNASEITTEDDSMDKKIEGLIKWCKSKKPGISDSEAKRWAQNIYNKKHGLSKSNLKDAPATQNTEVTQSDTTSDGVTLPNNREDLTKVMFGEKIDIPNYDKLNDNTKVFILEKWGNGTHDNWVTSVANISTYHGRLYLNNGGNLYHIKNMHELDTPHSNQKNVENVHSEAMTYGDLKNNVKQFIDQLDFKDEGYRFLTKHGHILHGVMIDKSLYNDDYCLFLTWDTNTCPTVKKRNSNRRKYKMSDGNTIIYVNPDDVYDAKKDGFHIVSEDGKEGHKTNTTKVWPDSTNISAKFELSPIFNQINDKDMYFILSTLCKFVGVCCNDSDMKTLRIMFGKTGNSSSRKVLDVIEKIHYYSNKDKNNLQRQLDVDAHNKSPKLFPHPDKIDVKKMKKPNLPNE